MGRADRRAHKSLLLNFSLLYVLLFSIPSAVSSTVDFPEDPEFDLTPKLHFSAVKAEFFSPCVNKSWLC